MTDYQFVNYLINHTEISRYEQMEIRLSVPEKLRNIDTIKDLSDLHARLCKIKYLEMGDEPLMEYKELRDVLVQLKQLGLYKKGCTLNSKEDYVNIIEDILFECFDPETGEAKVPIDRSRIKKCAKSDSKVFAMLSKRSGNLEEVLPSKRMRKQRKAIDLNILVESSGEEDEK